MALLQNDGVLDSFVVDTPSILRTGTEGMRGSFLPAFLLAILCLCGVSAADVQAEREFEAGAVKNRAATVMYWGGTGLFVAGALTLSPTLMLAGAPLILVGIPMGGSSSEAMVSSANKMNPHGTVEHKGWPLFWVGLGGLASPFVLGGNSTTALLSLGGLVCLNISWQQFSGSALRASHSYNMVRIRPAALVVSPPDGGKPAHGAQVTVEF